MEGSASDCHGHGGVRVVSRRLVQPSPAPTTKLGCGTTTTTIPNPETVHLTPWDLRNLTIEHIQKGVLLPKPPAAAGDLLVDHLARSLARALTRFHPFAGRLVAAEESGAVAVSLRCTGDGAEFVHAVAPGVAVADVAASLYVPRVVWSFFPLDGLVGADAVEGPGSVSRPVLAAQVTELRDGVFVAMALNHGVADGTAFWHLFNTWAHASRDMGGVGESDHDGHEGASVSVPPPALERWFPDGCPIPVPLPFGKLEHIVRRFHPPPLEECFLAFSVQSVRQLKARANAEAATTAADPPPPAAVISSLLSVLAHVWRGVTRARRLPLRAETSYTVLVGCRGRVSHLPLSYAGNAVLRCTATATAGEVLGNELGWAASRLRRAVAALDEAALVASAAAWHRDPAFAYLAGWWHPALLVTGNSPRFDAFGNDFGWGRPVAVRSGSANKVDGRATVYEGRDGGGSMGVEVCLEPDALARLVADGEFMSAVTAGKG
ncbi:hypothetical protein BS78_07G014700 [Paspalum vaginatum]|nr:hypothetical protein BS78_07G014700 [Paspalum vaginatum]